MARGVKTLKEEGYRIVLIGETNANGRTAVLADPAGVTFFR